MWTLNCVPRSSLNHNVDSSKSHVVHNIYTAGRPLSDKHQNNRRSLDIVRLLATAHYRHWGGEAWYWKFPEKKTLYFWNTLCLITIIKRDWEKNKNKTGWMGANTSAIYAPVQNFYTGAEFFAPVQIFCTGVCTHPTCFIFIFLPGI